MTRFHHIIVKIHNIPEVDELKYVEMTIFADLFIRKVTTTHKMPYDTKYNIECHG